MRSDQLNGGPFSQRNLRGVVGYVIEQIENAIVERIFEPGDRLPSPDELQRMLNVSRPTLREALRVLERKGLIELKPGLGGGAIVKRVNADQITESLALLIRYHGTSLSQLCEFRQGVEGNIAALAAERARTRDVMRLKKMLKEGAVYIEQEWKAFMRFDKELHLALSEITGNQLYISVIRMVYDNIQEFYERFFPKEVRWLWENYQDLREIVQAVEEGRSDEARALTQDHVRKFHEYMEEKERREHVSPIVNSYESRWSYKEAAEPFAGQTIRMIGENEAPWQAFDNMKSEFEELTGINVITESASAKEYFEKAESDSITLAESYDVFALPFLFTSKFAEQGLTLEIDELLKMPKIQDPNFDPRRDIHPEVWKCSSEWKGKYYGITYEFVPPLICYRKDLAEHPEEKKNFKAKYGYEMPIPPNTYYDLYDLVEFFTRKKGESLAGNRLKRNFFGTILCLKSGWPAGGEYLKILHALGGKLLNADGKITTDFQLNLKALEILLSFIRFSNPHVTEYGWEEQSSDMAAGLAFCFNAYADAFPYLENPHKSRVAGKLGYCLPPDRHFTLADSHTWNVSPHSKKKEAVWLWLQWVSSFDVQKRWHLSGGAAIRPDVMNDPDVCDIPYMRTVAESVDYLVEDMRVPRAMQVYDILSKAVRMAASAESGPEDVMRWAAKEQRKILSQ